jgi:predicted permease
MASIRSVTFYIALPGLFFREIGRRPLSLSVWNPFLNAILVQVTLHVFALPVYFLAKSFDVFSLIFSSFYSSFVFYGFPLVQFLFGDDYVHFPSLMLLAQLMFMVPLHKWLTYDPVITEETPVVSRGWRLVHSLVNTYSVFAVVGILWSALEWRMPIVLDQIGIDLEKSVMAAGLFSMGTFMYEVTISNTNWLIVCAYLLVHFVLVPVVSAFWCWALDFDSMTTLLCVLLHATPPDVISFYIHDNLRGRSDDVAAAIFWANAVSILVVFLWILLNNETSFFDSNPL